MRPPRPRLLLFRLKHSYPLIEIHRLDRLPRQLDHPGHRHCASHSDRLLSGRHRKIVESYLAKARKKLTGN